jgi:hypothetical protein
VDLDCYSRSNTRATFAIEYGTGGPHPEPILVQPRSYAESKPSDLAVELVEHGFDVRHAEPPWNVLSQRAELARGELIAAHGAFLDQERPHVLGEGLGDVRRKHQRPRALDDHHAVIHAMDVPAIAGSATYSGRRGRSCIWARLALPEANPCRPNDRVAFVAWHHRENLQ